MVKSRSWPGRHHENVRILQRPKLAVWAHDYTFLTKIRIETTLAFSTINGRIADGSTMAKMPEKKDSAIFCINKTLTLAYVDLEYIEDRLNVWKIEAQVEEPDQILVNTNFFGHWGQRNQM